MADFDAITTTLAARFSSANVTPPTGYTNIRAATADLPNAMGPLPAVFVFIDNGEFATGNGTRTGVHDFLVRFYYDEGQDLSRAMPALRKWLTILADQLKVSTQLGGIVTVARITTWKAGVLTYSGVDYVGLEFGVRIITDEPWAAVA